MSRKGDGPNAHGHGRGPRPPQQPRGNSASAAQGTLVPPHSSSSAAPPASALRPPDPIRGGRSSRGSARGTGRCSSDAGRCAGRGGGSSGRGRSKEPRQQQPPPNPSSSGAARQHAAEQRQLLTTARLVDPVDKVRRIQSEIGRAPQDPGRKKRLLQQWVEAAEEAAAAGKAEALLEVLVPLEGTGGGLGIVMEVCGAATREPLPGARPVISSDAVSKAICLAEGVWGVGMALWGQRGGLV